MILGNSSGGKGASERMRKINKDKRQPVMTRLAVRQRCSNLVTLITLRKETMQVKNKGERDKEKLYIEKTATP